MQCNAATLDELLLMRLGVVLVCDMSDNTQLEYQLIQLLSLQLSVPTCLASSRGASGSMHYNVRYNKPGVQGSVRCNIEWACHKTKDTSENN